MTAATFQSTVNVQLSFGVVGELITDGPQRVESLALDSAGGTIGFGFTKSNTTGVATMGGTPTPGTSVFAGILVNPKVYAAFGTSNPIDPTLSLPGYTQAEFLTMGTIIVALTGAGNIGDIVQMNITTGALSALQPGSTVTAGNVFIPNCVVYRYPTTAAGLVAIRITE